MMNFTRRSFLQSTALYASSVPALQFAGIPDALARRFPLRGRNREHAQKNVEVVGYTDVGGRPPFKLAIQEVGGRWLLYMGHLWDRGWSITDVTDPRNPELLNFIPGPANTWTIQMEVADNLMVTALERIAPGWGGNPAGAFSEGVLIWDLINPTNPQLLGQFETGGTGTHRNFYAGGNLVHLTAGMPGFRGNIYVIIDISNPTSPFEVGRWWVPGQREDEGEDPNVSQHGPPYVVGNVAFLAYGAAGLIILDISDPSSPTLISQLDFSPPFLGFIGAHSVLPLIDRNLAVVNSEAIREECNEPLNHTSMVDISDLSNPVLLSTFPIPKPPQGLPYTNFCDKGGRFGPHNVNQHFHSPFVEKRSDLVYLTYFNAGLQIYDTTDPRQPEEVGFFIPPNPAQRFGTKPEGDLDLQTEDVLVDARGYIYITQKNQGIWILRHTGR